MDNITKESVVAVVECINYEVENIYKSIKRGLYLVDPENTLFSENEKILLKPNLLAPDNPDKASTTHPSVFKAFAKILLERGVKVFYGDSPAFHSIKLVAAKSGIMKEADKLGVELLGFDESFTVTMKLPGRVLSLDIAEAVRLVDGIVSIAKLKTHGFTILTGAVKNQFGCIPGLKKSALHFKIDDLNIFSEMLVKLTNLIKPRLFIMDGIVGMEGNGPRRGNPVDLGIILISRDPIAIDSVAARIVGINPATVKTNVIGEQLKVGNMQNIKIVGDLIEYPLKRFSLPRYHGNINLIPAPLRKVIKDRLMPYPRIERKKCIKCYECYNVCPTNPKSIVKDKDGYVKNNSKTCIRCYCCQEICPVGAIDLKVKLF